MGIGAKIKWTRLEQGMTQENLAEGIVSMSYLSKIENERTTPSVDIVEMLCARLGIEADVDVDERLHEKVLEWCSLLRDMQNRDKIKYLYEEIVQMLSISRLKAHLLFEIHQIKYYLIFAEYDEALVQINKLKKIDDSFDLLQKYYWYKFRGNYYSLTGDHVEALRLYELAEENMKRMELEDEEVADTQYTIAVSHSKLRQTLETIEYTEPALDVYQKSYNFTRCAHCHILLGIAYRRLKMYDKAIKNQNLAKHLGEMVNNKQIIQLSNQNLGYLHSVQGNPTEAINHYEEVAFADDVQLIEKIAATTALIREYHSLNKLKEAKEMIKKNKELLDTNMYNDEYKYFYFTTYTYDYALNDEIEKFESIIKDDFLPYLRKNKDYANLVTYTRMIADHFESQKKYKEASKYYKLANVNYEELVDI
ncbi:Transcriptional activator NprA [Lentibacillus sp. JNUCC-1]|uniref:helix-turn-helix domain-containing protein n=1 Tax=Lentibacillus sp. JNUCC-1 TaxID=2654513 RepID=UPI0012E761CA|nr:helix-turn-helix transcriptional regulator [Lentibacillus sp. JNUCC-1]MUV38603.1 Transcriptional activator NprA [Lentibacillus sp. JNUCC-1]